MKKHSLLPVLSLSLLAALICIQSGCSGLGISTVEKTESHSAPFSASSSLTAETGNGTITVARTNNPELVVDATIRSRTEERLQATLLIVRESADGIYEVTVKWPDDERLMGEGADLKIRLPGASDLRLATSNGALRVDGLDAAIKASTTNGSVTIIGPARSATVTTTNGRIDLNNIAGEVLARTTNGRIEASLAPENPGPVILTSTNGGIALLVGPSFAGQVSVRTSNGQIRLGDFEPGARPSTVKSGRRTGQFNFGDAGKGSVLTTTNGNVTIGPIDP